MSNYVPGVPWNVNTSGTGPDAARAIATEKAAAQAQVKSIEAQIAKERADLKTQQNNLALKEAEIVEYKKSQTPKLKPEGPGTPNLGQQAVINTFEVAKGKIQEKIVAINSKLRTLDNRLKAFKNQLAAVISAEGGNESYDNETTTLISSADADKLIYQYNLPMLKSAYLNPFGPQGTALIDRKLIGAPINDFNNARLAWKGVTPSRGTIQMSRLYAENANYSTSVAKGRAKNDTPYGFRFLYNPTEVSMAWGIVDAFSPEYAQSGANGMSGVAVGLMKGTIAFSLLLNRIGDMNVLQDDGSYANYFFENDPGANPNVYSQILYPAVGTQVVPVIPVPVIPSEANGNPWGLPQDPSLEERAAIAKRGTMYDIEYLFRAMGGYYADYESGLNGKTADRGWLQPIPMELHLGAGLRYLVRVSSLDLKHMMFNERMVPTLTTVNVTCTRYYDSPDAFTDPTAYSPETTPTS
jgi:hypothetical protein